ncbi:LacI family DNA-binding transcriptional regulator [Macrococcus sp. DPC7161]|uniref:LacI family DNA-binding transcriptional regulator n=1 Tax=Macrococcus sp. DPC7161 TaxID=2507060 RepID=UPI00100AB0DF|nr:LacI family DNA-binding transcriptional regulator [Macrococcus sp. DPC7161]RXK18721.1 LacI family transcriptional regulator [Macrococcus sp. DPC7161]
MVTIKDVARVADVAPSTVSRVISNNSSISEATRKRVLSVMDELGYVPNLTARQLVTNKSKTIGLVLKTASIEMRQNPFFTDVLMSISEVCKKHQYTTLVTTSMTDHELLDEVKRLVSSKLVDGLILLYSRENDAVMAYLKAMQFPYVVVGKALNDGYKTMYIDNDNIAASEALTSYMINLGHRSMVFIREHGEFLVSRDRAKGFVNICEKVGIKYEVFEMDSDRQAAIDLIHSFQYQPTAIITSDSMMNLNVLSALYELDIRIPTDIQTATFNDSYLNDSACPPQTVVNINPEHLGSIASEKLIQLLNDANMVQHNIIIPTTIIERQSTKRIEG